MANGSMSVYRGDSFICASAIHTGIIDNAQGGAGVVSLVGEQHQFPSRSANGIQSIEFQPSFPVAFTFLNQSPAGQGPSNLCRDSRWNLLIVAVILTTLLSIFTTSPATLYFTTFVGAYFTVSLSTDPRSFKAFYSGISASIGDFLPCMFVCIVVYRYCILRTLSKLRAQIEKTILWLGGFWVGALSNYTFEKLPLQRLTPRDIQSQPGALPTVIIGAIVTLAVAVGQGWAFRREGRLPRFLAFYATTFIIIGLLAAVPGLNLRLHHYIMALILLPGTAIQTRPSLLYQGFLVGLFINGVARWGFDSILQTSSELFQLSLDPTEPKIPLPQIQGSNITFNWGKLPAGYDSMAILINDVMRFQGYEDHNPESFSWTRYREGEPEYFRFGYLKYGSTQGTAIGLYTNPGTWLPNGTWTPIKPRY